MLKTYDENSQAQVECDNIKYYDEEAQAWVQANSAKAYDNAEQAWVEHLSAYVFKYYEHDSPGGAVETISSDGTSVTITVPDKNFGASGFIFASDIPASAAGQELTVSFVINASHTGTVTDNYLGDIHVRLASASGGTISTLWFDEDSMEQILDTGRDVTCSCYVNTVSDKAVQLELGLYFYYELTTNKTLTFTVKDVLINGKPCRFNFK